MIKRMTLYWPEIFLSSPLERSEKDRGLPNRNSGEAQFGFFKNINHVTVEDRFILNAGNIYTYLNKKDNLTLSNTLRIAVNCLVHYNSSVCYFNIVKLIIIKII
jgi:hypothetical protein